MNWLEFWYKPARIGAMDAFLGRHLSVFPQMSPIYADLELCNPWESLLRCARLSSNRAVALGISIYGAKPLGANQVIGWFVVVCADRIAGFCTIA